MKVNQTLVRMVTTSFVFKTLRTDNKFKMQRGMKMLENRNQKIVTLKISKQMYEDFLFVVENVQEENNKLIIAKLFEDMYQHNFKSYSSVIGTEAHIKNRFSDFDLLMRIDLYAHSLNVVKNVIANNLKNSSLDEKIIIALAHDFGKCRTIAELTQYKASAKHAYASSEYLLNLAKQMDLNESYSNFFYGLRYHHDEGSRKKTGIYGAMYEADMLARETEVKQVKFMIKQEQRNEKKAE